MKVIKYTYEGQTVEMGWNEVNEETAKREADGGSYVIEDDGLSEEAEVTLDSRVASLEENNAETKEALDMILSGVTEDEA